jgi:hypothetical protein
MSLQQRLSIRVFTLGCFALALAVSVAGQAASPLTGTWKINLATSKYSPTDLAPKSGTTRFDVMADSVKAVVDGVDSQGRKTHQEYTATFDGKDTPCGCTLDGKPSADQDTVAWKKVDNRTYEITSKLNGKALTVNHIAVAADGKSRTNTVTGTNAKGQTVNHTVHYDKQ